MSRREQALQALQTALLTVPGATVERDAVVPERVAASGLIILRDGSRPDPEITISPRIYHWQHDAVVEVLVQDADNDGRAASLDALLAAIDTAIAADRRLGGVVEWAEPTGLTTSDLAIPAGAALKGAVVTVTLVYSTDSVLD